ncbi:3-deoxy-D-manno-octulosonic acid kinase [Vibrio algivorus]|uniref:3-deoxy-D-manno-octulosonic acid kinase n=1 Tax=Vibrio algivorus TaxID=1667024 RepID=A0ABQ6EKS1_9VIBR|nr:3-deoxy-D-manno-octulosonic acid kinase [Vibrio algivorus]GLT13152.1 3-deoxy-D-manno-octulosonic acid kinase [Vibrio algivorus]
MKTLTSYKQVIWYDETLITDSIEQIFEPEYWYAQGKVIGSAQGRGTTWFVQTEQLPAALRHYRRGGLFGKLVKDHYWFSQWHKTRSYEEFQLLQHLVDSGVNVPKPIAARAIKRTLCYQADILTQKVEGAEDLVGILQKRSLERETYVLIGEQIRHLHRASVNHTDLNIHNILLDNDNKVWIIDFDKCRIELDLGETNFSVWQKSNLDRLLRSFQKELGKRHINWVQSTDWSALEAGYHQ